MYFQTRAVILESELCGESDRRFSVFCEELGKIQAIAPGSQKIKSRLTGHLQPPMISTLDIFFQNRKFRIIGAYCQEPFQTIRNKAENMGLALNITALTSHMLTAREQNSDIWNLLINTMRMIEQKPVLEPEIAKVIMKEFLQNFLTIQGYFDPQERQADLISLKYKVRQIIAGMI